MGLQTLETVAGSVWQNNVSRRKRMTLDEQCNAWISIDAAAKRERELVSALQAIASALDGKRNRFGKLETYTCDTEPLRVLAVQYAVTGSSDLIEQAVKVARAALAKVAP